MVSDTANNTRKNQLPDLPVCKMLTEENQNRFLEWGFSKPDLWGFWESGPWVSRSPEGKTRAMSTFAGGDLLTSCLFHCTLSQLKAAVLLICLSMPSALLCALHMLNSQYIFVKMNFSVFFYSWNNIHWGKLTTAEGSQDPCPLWHLGNSAF